MIESRLRSLHLSLAGFSFVGLLVELLLQSHTGLPAQWTPIILIILGLVAVTLGLAMPRRWVIIGLRAVGTLVAAGAALGVVLHLAAAMAAERELVGEAAALREVLQGVLLVYAPPLLAPGALAVGGLLLIASTYRHPAMARTEGG